ncbi:hypothetical protein ACJMK2_013373 [Sinanodonta woodiana]|uniref:Uncharacterized protein n=1 Tax=Sinanodonta woodiana TaxID=1069815 RepID=A0ABD3UXB9_SINWO
MNDDNIVQLNDELDKLAQYVPPGNTFTSEWLEDAYSGVTTMRNEGKPSYRNKYRIIKILIEARTKVLLKHKDKLALFVPLFEIIQSIEDALKEEFNSRRHAKEINDDFKKLAKLSL